ncbi:MAG: winged helix-turn-helix transcriptional regulator [Anaerolineales bacterium]|nr:winged helix-turn-helix transcriptional regulator [Anaerolineales bacterium]
MDHSSAIALAEKQASLCRVFGNARRLLILWAISKEELPVHEIAARAGSSLQNVSQHLNLLKKSGIVTARREGQTIYYQIADHIYLKNCPALSRAPDVLEKTNE